VFDVLSSVGNQSNSPRNTVRLPNFFVVGAPKAGTTSIYHYLRQHPQVFMSPLKEPHYFAEEVREENLDTEMRHHYVESAKDPNWKENIVADWQGYLELFEEVSDEIAIGEASAGYLQSLTAPSRIFREIPEARIVIMLRDPAERAFSQYLQGFGCGVISCSFRNQIERYLGASSRQISSYYPFLEFGFYADQVRRYRELFGDRVWIGLHQDYQSRPSDLCRDLFTFLGVDPSFAPHVGNRYREAQVPRVGGVGWLKRAGIWKAAANLTPRSIRPFVRRALIRRPGTVRMDPSDRRFLVNFYREDIQKLAKDLDRNLDTWLA
jgi:Sulfotransferase family